MRNYIKENQGENSEVRLSKQRIDLLFPHHSSRSTSENEDFPCLFYQKLPKTFSNNNLADIFLVKTEKNNISVFIQDNASCS